MLFFLWYMVYYLYIIDFQKNYDLYLDIISVGISNTFYVAYTEYYIYIM